MQQRESFPVGIAAFASIDGTNNFHDSYSPALGAVVSREFGGTAPSTSSRSGSTTPTRCRASWSTTTTRSWSASAARVRVRPTVYVVAEIAPRIFGFDPETTTASFAIEKRAGGHTFQLNFSNAFGTTMAQVARGGEPNADGGTTGTSASTSRASSSSRKAGGRAREAGGLAGAGPPAFWPAAAACGRRGAPSAASSRPHARGGPRRFLRGTAATK